MKRLLSLLLPALLLGGKPDLSAQESGTSAGAEASRLPLVFLLEAKPHAAEEGPEAGQLLVVRFGDTNTALEVSYDVSGTALNEVDYQPLLGRVRIPAGEHVAPIIITPIDDALPEPRESVIIQLTHPTPENLTANEPDYRIGFPGRAVIGIRDNDETVNHPPVVDLINPPDGAVLRGPLDINLMAFADDSDGWVREVEFFAGPLSLGVASNLFVAAPLGMEGIGDALPAADALTGVNVSVTATNLISPPVLPPVAPFFLTWSNAPVGEHLIRAVATDNRGARRESRSARIRIEADTALPRVNVFTRDAHASEAGTANGLVDTATFVIHRSGNTDAALSVDFRLSGTAAVSNDFNAVATSVMIPAGTREVEVTITPIDDQAEEPRESVVLELQPIACIEIFPPPPGCYELGRTPRAAAWIEDNDRVVTNHPPVVEIVRPERNAILVEPDSYLLVANARDLDGWIRSVEFFDGDASLGIVSNGPSILAGPIAPGGFGAVLPPWSLNWTNIAPGSHLLRAVATDNAGATRSSRGGELTVVTSNSLPVVTVLAPDNIAREPDPVTDPAAPRPFTNAGLFRVARTGPTTEPLIVHFHVAGSARNGVDYSFIPATVVIPVGEQAVDIRVRPQDDSLVEGPESVVLSLRDEFISVTGAAVPSRYIIGNPFRAEVVIQDNDVGTENRPPEAVVLAPTDGSVLRREAEIRIAVHARDHDGHIVRLEAFANNEKVADQVINYFEAPPPGMRETFTLAWTNAAPGEYRLRVRVSDNDGGASMSPAVDVKIIEEHEPTVVWITAPDPDASEGGTTAATDDTNVGVFKVSRRGNLDHKIRVLLRLNGSAEHLMDYRLHQPQENTDGIVMPPLPPTGDTTRATLSLRFAAGQTERLVVVEPIDDTRVEPAESVIATIDPPVCIALFPPPPGCYQLGESGRATVVIRDNDEQRNRAPSVVIASPVAGQKFTAPAAIEFSVHTRDEDGWVSQMEFYAGERKLGDSVVHFIRPPDPNERQRFSLVWTNVPAGEHILRAKATDNLGASAWSAPVAVRVREESAVPIMNLYAKDARASESAHTNGQPNNATFVVTRRGSTNQAVTVFLEIGGRAENGVDYETIPPTVTIPAGEREAVIVVKPIDDNLTERRESVVLRLVYPDLLIPLNHEIGLHPRAAALIADNDRPEPSPGTERPAVAEALEDGVVHVVVTGDLAEEVIVEGTDNLRDWFEIARGFMTDGRIDFVEAAALERAARFYRVIPVNRGLPVVHAQRVFGN